MTHALKTSSEYFELVASGHKTFELRKADRPFLTGDKMLLQEVEAGGKIYTGRELELTITTVLGGDEGLKLGLRKGFCLISFFVIGGTALTLPKVTQHFTPLAEAEPNFANVPSLQDDADQYAKAQEQPPIIIDAPVIIDGPAVIPEVPQMAAVPPAPPLPPAPKF